MRKPVFITGEEAAAMIADNATVATIGMTLVSAAETILKAIEQRFLETGSPRGLTLVHSCGQSDRDRVSSILPMRPCSPESSGATGDCSPE